MIEASPSSSSGRRLAVKQTAIASALRLQIIKGEYAPGARLPTRVDLEARYRASTITIQRALDELAVDGFIQARGAQGTFVADRPPHLCHYGLVLPWTSSANRQTWSKYWLTLERVAQTFANDEDRRVSLLFGAEGRIDSPDYRNLLTTVRNHRVAGLILGTAVIEQGESRRFDFPRMPRVSCGFTPFDSTPTVSLDQEGWFVRALDSLVARGRRRVGMFFTVAYEQDDVYLKMLEREAARRDITILPYWLQPCMFPIQSQPRSVAQLLGKLAPELRPDAVLIRDDNLEEPILAGLLSAGVRVGEEIEVISHANFPTSLARLAPVRRLGFDCRHLLTAAMDLIDRQIDGEQNVGRVLIPAMFEEELNEGSAIN